MKLTACLSFLLLCCFIHSSSQTPGQLILDFKTGRFANDKIWDIDKYPGARYLIAGNFITYDDYPVLHLAVLNSDLTLDTTFAPAWNLSVGDVKFAERVAGGKIIVAGNFTHTGTTNYHCLLRLNADGTIDETFPDVFADADENVVIHAMEFTDEYIMLAGNFNFPDDAYKRCILRIDYDGNIDTTFKTYFGLLADEPDIFQLQITSDEKYVVSGAFAGYEDDYSIKKLMKLHHDGSRDISFIVSEVTPADRYVYFLGIQSDDKILVGGSFNEINGSDEHGFAKLDPDGTRDITFNPGELKIPGPYTNPYKLTHSYTTENGHIIIAGGFDQYSYITPYSIYKLEPSGGTTAGFRNSEGIGVHYSVERETYEEGVAHIQDFVVLNSGDITIAGSFNAFDDAQCNNVCQLDSMGYVNPDMPEQLGFDDDVRKIIVQPDGKILVLGKFTEYGYNEHVHLIRLNSNAEPDSSFSFSTDDELYDMELLDDGKILIAGDFMSVNGVSRRTIARLNSDGSTDITFNPGGGATGGAKTIYDIAVLPDGKILIGGSFTVYNAVTRKNFARLHANGSIDTSFDPLTGFDAPVWEIALTSDGKYIIGGEFTKYRGANYKSIIRLQDDANPDTTFSSIITSGNVYALECTEDEKILAGGTFTLSGSPNNKFVKLNNDGSADASFTSSFTSNAEVHTIKKIHAGYYAVGGKFEYYDAVNYESFLMLDENGTVHPDFIFDKKTDSLISTIALDADSNIIIGGAFVSLNGYSRNRIAKLSGITDTPPVCSMPTGVTATGITASTAKIKWDIVPGAETYRVQYRVEGTTSWTSKTSFTNQKKIKLLAPSTTYEYRVRSQCADAAVSTYSAIQTFTTLPMRFTLSDSTQAVEIFPNPVHDAFTVTTENSTGLLSISLYDASGKLLQQETLFAETGNTYTMHLTTNYTGIACVKIITASETVNKQIFITR